MSGKTPKLSVVGNCDQPKGNTPEARRVSEFMLACVLNLPPQKRAAVLEDFATRMKDLLAEGTHSGNTVHDIMHVFSGLAIKHNF